MSEKFRCKQTVICVDMHNTIGGWLTIGKKYEVLGIRLTINGLGLRILTDDGNKFIFPSSFFKPLDEYRDDIIDDILE